MEVASRNTHKKLSHCRLAILPVVPRAHRTPIPRSRVLTIPPPDFTLPLNILPRSFFDILPIRGFQVARQRRPCLARAAIADECGKCGACPAQTSLFCFRRGDGYVAEEGCQAIAVPHFGDGDPDQGDVAFTCGYICFFVEEWVARVVGVGDVVADTRVRAAGGLRANEKGEVVGGAVGVGGEGAGIVTARVERKVETGFVALRG